MLVGGNLKILNSSIHVLTFNLKKEVYKKYGDTFKYTT